MGRLWYLYICIIDIFKINYIYYFFKGVSKNDKRFKKLDLTDGGLLSKAKCIEMIENYNREQDNNNQ